MIATTFHDAHTLGLGAGSVLLLLGFQLGGTAMELLGLAALVPVFQYIQAGGDVAALVAEFRWWSALQSVYGWLGLPITLASLLAVTMAALLLRQSFVYVRLRYQAAVKEGLLARARAEGFAHYLAADVTFQDRYDAGRVVNDLTTELARAVEYVFSGITLIGFAIIFLVYLGALFGLSGPLTLLALGIFGIAILAVRGPLAKTEAVSHEIVEANQAMSGFLVERLKLVRLIRLAGMVEVEAAQMRRLTDRQRDRMVRIFALLANLEIIVEPLVIGAALVFLYVSISIFGIRLEYVGLFLLLVVRLLPVVKEATRVRQSKRGTQASYRAVTGQMAEMRAARERPTGTRPFIRLREGIRFETVVFAYPKRGAATAPADAPAAALNGVTALFPAGQVTALVGPSGAGKSTLVDLIPRLRRPQSGAILLDGIDIGDFALDSLRAGIAYAPQMPQVFNVSMAEHIRYGKPDATMDEVRRAAALANAAPFIQAMPDGYDTLAGDGGGRLSGGQRQRLDLARALVRQAPILLLDEPTSNLDADSEALFRDALKRIRRETDSTVIVIAHRLSTVTMADVIIVLQDGRVAACGSHAQLIAAGGWYRNAFLKQGGTAAVTAAQ